MKKNESTPPGGDYLQLFCSHAPKAAFFCPYTLNSLHAGKMFMIFVIC